MNMRRTATKVPSLSEPPENDANTTTRLLMGMTGRELPYGIGVPMVALRLAW
jgi:hypothetical protein